MFRQWAGERRMDRSGECRMPRRTLAARLRRHRATLALIALVVLAIAASAALGIGGGHERPVPEAAELAAAAPATAVQRVDLIDCDPLDDPAPAATPLPR